MEALREHKNLIRKNAFWLFAGQIVGRFLRAVMVIYPYRLLTKESWGALNYALSAATLLTVLSDIGVNALLTREASRNPEGRQEYISTALFIKLGVLFILSIGFLIFSTFISRNQLIAELLPSMLFLFVFDSLRDFGSAIARAMEKMEKEGVNNILTNVFIVIIAFALLAVNKSAASVMIAYALGAGLGLISIAISLGAELAKIFSNFNRSLVRHIVMAAWPFGVLGLMGTIMINTDIFIINWLLSLRDVALYSAPQKIIQILYIAPVLISTSFFPALAKYVKDKEKFAHLFETALSAILLIAIPLAAGLIVLSSGILRFVYGEVERGSQMVFITLALTVVVIFPSVLIGNAIFAHNKQRGYLIYSLGGIVGNIVLDLMLIPVWGIEGSAIATLINQIIINIYAWLKMRQICEFRILGRLKKIIFASLCMSFSAYALAHLGIGVLINSALSILLYFAILILLDEESLSGFWTLRRRND